MSILAVFSGGFVLGPQAPSMRAHFVTEVVQTNRGKFPDVSDAELADRLKFAEELRRKLSTMQTEVNDPKYKSKPQPLRTVKSPDPETYSKLNDESRDDYETQRNQQEMLERQQDLQVDQLSSAITTVKHTAVAIRDELKEQEIILNDMDNEMDTLGAKLKHASKKMEALIKDSKDRKKLCCIVVLIVVLIVIIALFFVL